MIELILNLVQSVVVRRDAGVVDLLESHDHRISNAGLVDRNHFAVVVEPVRFRAQDFHLGTSRRADLRHFRLLFRRRGSFTLFLRNEKREKKVSARTPKKHYYIGGSSSRAKTRKKQPLKKKNPARSDTPGNISPEHERMRIEKRGASTPRERKNHPYLRSNFQRRSLGRLFSVNGGVPVCWKGRRVKGVSFSRPIF